MQLDDLNHLLTRRQTLLQRLQQQATAVCATPKEGVTLPQLAARASLAATLQAQNAELVKENGELHVRAQRADRAEQTAADLQVSPLATIKCLMHQLSKNMQCDAVYRGLLMYRVQLRPKCHLSEI